MQVFNAQRHPIMAWTDGVEFDDNAFNQVANVANLPFIFRHVAVMPDVHFGMGATVGSVIATIGAVVPAAVGVDLGCGMSARRTGINAKHLPDNLGPLRAAIEAAVPHGRTDNGGANDRGAWHNIPDAVTACTQLMYASLSALPIANDARFYSRWIGVLAYERQLGTLGTGNHFIEVCLDENDDVWVMLHSGSRGIGNAIGTYYIQKAQDEMKRWMIDLPDKDLAYLPEGSPLFDEYVAAVGWAQDYAAANRAVMMESVLRAVGSVVSVGNGVFAAEEAISCHHNYVARENHFGKNVIITRKGAVRAREGDLGIIPGSMGAKSFIVRGKGNRDSFMSCSHGAGRRLGRNEAKRQFTTADLAAQTSGVECRKDADVIDEIPGAYKSIDSVMAAQSDLVDIVHTIRGIVCVKG
jgi:tRNA-splicing ligase RtcB